MILKNKNIMEGKKHLVKGLDVDFVVDHLLSLEDSDNFDLINKLSDLWEVYNKSWNKFNNFLSDFWKVMKNIEKLDSFDKTCKEIIDAWYDDIEKIFYSDDNLENFKLNYGFRGNDVFESLKEDIQKSTWGKWVVDKVYNVYGFFDGEEVNGRVIDNLLNELGIDTDFDTVKNEIIKGIKSYKLGDLDYWAIHIGHGANGNRFDIHGRVAYSSELIQLIDKDGTVTVYFDVQEQGEDDAWNFGFIADVGVKVRPVIDTNLVESLKEGINDELIATSSDGETTLYLSDERQANHGKDPHYEFKLGENGYFTRYVRCDDNRCEKVVLDWIKQFNLDISKSEISRIIKLHESKKSVRKSLKEQFVGKGEGAYKKPRANKNNSGVCKDSNGINHKVIFDTHVEDFIVWVDNDNYLMWYIYSAGGLKRNLLKSDLDEKLIDEIAELGKQLIYGFDTDF